MHLAFIKFRYSLIIKYPLRYSHVEHNIISITSFHFAFDSRVIVIIAIIFYRDQSIILKRTMAILRHLIYRGLPDYGFIQ